MNEVKHTPGPWHVEDPMGDICLSIVDDAEHTYDWKMVANVTWSEADEKGQKSFVSYKTAEANARLIATAPDFIAAAKDIISSRSSTYKARNGKVMSIEDDSGEMVWLVPFDALLALEAAIAKAEGSS